MRRVDQLDLASAVRALRGADLSQRELAQRAGVPSSTVSRIESGEISNPRVRTLVKLAEAAGGKLTIAPATTVEDPAASTALDPVPHDHLTDVIGRRYPTHLDVWTTFPYFGRDWTLLDPGTPVRTYRLNRDVRDDIRASRAPAATLRIARAELVPERSWCWTARIHDESPIALLTAQIWPMLVPYPWLPADAVVCGLAIKPTWRSIGVEEKLLAALRDEIAHRQVSEVALIGYRLGDTPYLRGLGFQLASKIMNIFRIDLGVIDA